MNKVKVLEWIHDINGKDIFPDDIIDIFGVIQDISTDISSKNEPYVRLVLKDGTYAYSRIFSWRTQISDFNFKEGDIVKIRGKVSNFRGYNSLSILIDDEGDLMIKVIPKEKYPFSIMGLFDNSTEDTSKDNVRIEYLYVYHRSPMGAGDETVLEIEVPEDITEEELKKVKKEKYYSWLESSIYRTDYYTFSKKEYEEWKKK